MARKFITKLLALCFLSLITMANAEEVSLEKEDFQMLVGGWTGIQTLGDSKKQKQNMVNPSSSEVEIELEITEDARAKFHRIDKGKKWSSDADIVDGKVQMGYGKKKRLFTLDKTDDQLILTTEFKRKKGAEDRYISVVLQKL